MELRIQLGEAFVFPGTEMQKMRYRPYSGSWSVQLRSHVDTMHPENRRFQQGIDYIVDGEDGTIFRLASGAIPDWRRLANQYEVALADVQKLWLAELAAGKSNASLLMNNVNHPNEYGHSLYARALAELL